MAEPDDDFLDFFVENLDRMKKNGHKATLILGSRASSLFYCTSFYKRMEYHGYFTFSRKKRWEQFKESYDILTRREKFSVMGVDEILTEALEAMDSKEDRWTRAVRKADLYLAVLLMQGIFDMVISLRLDNCLELSLNRLGMHKDEDYTVYDGYNKQGDFSEGQKCPLVLVSVFGEVGLSHCGVNRNSYFHERPQLGAFIKRAAQKHVVLLGYDPSWDGTLGEILPENHDVFWYINEDGIDGSPDLRRLTETREFHSYVHPGGSYERFIENVYWKCGGQIPVHYLTQAYIFNSQVTLQQDFISLRALLEDMLYK